MRVRFSETTLDQGRRHIRLMDLCGNALLELKGYEIDDAIRAGFLDPANYHFSMYEYARIRTETGLSSSGTCKTGFAQSQRPFDINFLRDLNILGD
jgi:hypothetical protein